MIGAVNAEAAFSEGSPYPASVRHMSVHRTIDLAFGRLSAPAKSLTD